MAAGSLLSLPFLDWPLKWRDRLLADPRFHAFCARTPLFSAISKRRTAELFDVASGFVKTQTLTACLSLGLFDILKAGPLPVAEIARRSGLDEAAADRLVRAAVACRLLAWRGGKVGLGALGAAVNGSPGVRAMVRHNQAFYRDIADPVALLKGEAPPGELKAYWPYAGAAGAAAETGGDAAAYSDLMAQSQDLIAGDVLDAVDIRPFRRLMDVGGGDGTFLRAAARRAPELALTLFDLPGVARIAEPRFAAAGLAARTTAVAGDFGRDSLPVGADVVSLVRIAHDHDDPVVEKLFAAVFAALEPGGTLIIAEPMSGIAGAEAMSDVYFGFYFLAMGAGRARRPDELASMLVRAGFETPRLKPTRRPLMASVMLAKKPAA
ncbi:MAG: methyltransferase [Beijerinckiaceae bacterium]